MASRVQVQSLSKGTVWDITGTGIEATFGARVEIFQANTNTYVTVYRDSTGGTTITQPLLTDHEGNAPGWILPQQIVDFAINGGPVVQVNVPTGTPALADLTDGASWIALINAGGQAMGATAVKTSAYTPAPSEFVPVDTTGGAVTITLPAAPMDKTRIGVKLVKGSNTVTISRGGSTDVFDVAAGPTTHLLTNLYQSVVLQYQASTGIWYIQAEAATLTGYAPLISPALSGTPTTTTPSVDDNSFKIADTAYVIGQLASANPVMDGTAAPGTATRIARSDHVHPSDTSRLAAANNFSEVTDMEAARFNIRVPSLRAARAAATSNIATLSGLQTIDGYTMLDGERLLLTAQTTGSQNGPWIAHSGSWLRPNDYPTGGVIAGRMMLVEAGSLNAGIWTSGSTTSVTIGTTATTWHQLPDRTATVQQTFAGAVVAPLLSPSGSTGATAATRWVGATASGAPTSGTWGVGDWVTAQDGNIWICTVAGTPGTWVKPQKKMRIPHTWTIGGPVGAETGSTDVTNYLVPFYVPLATGQTAQAVGYKCSIGGGTSATVKVQKNGTDLTGFTGISVTTTDAEAFPTAQSVAAGDKLKLVVTAISAAPVNLSFSLYLEHTI